MLFVLIWHWGKNDGPDHYPWKSGWQGCQALHITAGSVSPCTALSPLSWSKQWDLWGPDTSVEEKLLWMENFKWNDLRTKIVILFHAVHSYKHSFKYLKEKNLIKDISFRNRLCFAFYVCRYCRVFILNVIIHLCSSGAIQFWKKVDEHNGYFIRQFHWIDTQIFGQISARY